MNIASGELSRIFRPGKVEALEEGEATSGTCQTRAGPKGAVAAPWAREQHGWPQRKALRRSSAATSGADRGDDIDDKRGAKRQRPLLACKRFRCCSRLLHANELMMQCVEARGMPAISEHTAISANRVSPPSWRLAEVQSILMTEGSATTSSDWRIFGATATKTTRRGPARRHPSALSRGQAQSRRGPPPTNVRDWKGGALESGPGPWARLDMCGTCQRGHRLRRDRTVPPRTPSLISARTPRCTRQPTRGRDLADLAACRPQP